MIQERSYAPIRPSDLARLAAIALEDREDLFARKRELAEFYRDRILCTALCQGAALHYLGHRTGVKDFDVWTFYAARPEKAFPCRRRARCDFGRSRFGRHPADRGYDGRRVDLLGRSIPYSGGDPVLAVRDYLAAGRSKTARRLAEKGVIVLEPADRRGEVIWPEGPVAAPMKGG